MPDVVLRIVDDNVDDAGLADYTERMRRSLLDVDLQADLRQCADAPDGARSSGAFELGVVIVQAVAESGVLEYVFDVVRGWLGRSEAGDVEVTLGDAALRLKDATPLERQQIIDHFIAVTSKPE